MKRSIKRSCNGCKALTKLGCDLGKKTKITMYTHISNSNERKPLEACYKPKSDRDYSFIKKIQSIVKSKGK